MIPVHYERLQTGRLDGRERLVVGGRLCGVGADRRRYVCIRVFFVCGCELHEMIHDNRILLSDDERSRKHLRISYAVD